MIAAYGGSHYSKFGKQPQSGRQQVMRGPHHKSINQHPQQAGPAAVASQSAAAVHSKTFHQGQGQAQGQTFNLGQGQQQQNVYNGVYVDDGNVYNQVYEQNMMSGGAGNKTYDGYYNIDSYQKPYGMTGGAGAGNSSSGRLKQVKSGVYPSNQRSAANLYPVKIPNYKF